MFYSEQFILNLFIELENSNSSLIDLDDILFHCNILVHSKPNSNKAFIIKYDKYFCIIIDSNMPYEKYRESLAHEIGHVLLNHFSSKKSHDIKESEANNIAFFLLIPTKKLEEELYNYDTSEELIPYLSTIFKVTHKFMNKRLDLYKKSKSFHNLLLSNPQLSNQIN